MKKQKKKTNKKRKAPNPVRKNEPVREGGEALSLTFESYSRISETKIFPIFYPRRKGRQLFENVESPQGREP
jgi:hypothetical protein